MLPVQVLQQHLLVLLPPLVPRHVLAPAADRGRQSPGHVRLLDNLRDGLEVRADGEGDGARAGQAPQRLPLRAEVVVLDGAVLLRRVPADGMGGRVLGPDAVRPRQVVVDLDEVVVAEDGVLGPQAAEEVHHPLFQFLLVLGHRARGVDLREGHAEFVLEAPEPRQEDRPREEVVLPVFLFDHEREVVLDEAGGRHHGVFRQGPLDDVEGLPREEVVDADVGLLEHGGVSLGEVRAATGRYHY